MKIKLNSLAILFAGLFILFGTSLESIAQDKELSNELIWYSGEFRTEYVGGINSMNDGVHYTSLEFGDAGSDIIKYSYASGEKVQTVATSKEVFGDLGLSIEDYEFSADESKLLVATDVESIYRHSTAANYYIWDIKSKKLTPLSDFSKGKQRLADFSPSGNSVAFVRENNVFIYSATDGSETQVTSDGVVNEVINGATDWVYEEEFGFDKGLYWSNDGNKLAYYRFDESAVKEFQMAMYGDLYPEQYKFKYPKAGEVNSTVSIHVYDLNTNKSRLVNTGTETDIYYPRIKWTEDPNQLCIMRMNRHQNELEFLLCDNRAKSTILPTTVIYKEAAKTYVEVNDNLFFSKDGQGFYWNSEKDGYNHIYYVVIAGGGMRQLTSGNWDVIDFYGVDESKGMLYFSSSQESTLEKHVYAKGIKNRSFIKLSKKAGTNDGVFSNTFRYFINYNSSANTAPYITMNDNKGKELRVLKDNAALMETMSAYDLSPKEFFTFDNSSGDMLNCWMIKPNGFDPSKKYPVFVTIYGGPGHNTVLDSWDGRNLLWHQMLAEQGYIVVSCDPRGTMYRGREFKHSTYQQLGKLETEDFIDFAKHLQGLDYVDADRIGIQGWSYGGYMTSLCMTKGADYYKTGIAVAPVTNWRYYDSIYTERFMRTPQENASGYDDNSPINHVDLLKGKYLLVHGSADDNVHYQNTMEMIDALVRANKQFDLFIYPNKNHGIYGGTTRLHLFTKMTNFVKDNL